MVCVYSMCECVCALQPSCRDGITLCCAVLGLGLGCAVLQYAMLCWAVLCWAGLSCNYYAVLCWAGLWI